MKFVCDGYRFNSSVFNRAQSGFRKVTLA